MKKDYKTKKTTRLLILLTIMSFMLFGCGNTQVESTPAPVPEEKEPEVVAEVETTVEETTTAEEESETTEETTEVEEQYQTPVSSMIDWETFAAQEDNDDICLAISNETTSVQTVLYEGGFYPYREGDRIAIPIKENIKRVCYYESDENGKQKDKVKDLYWKGDAQVKYIEFEVGNEAAYYVSIFDDSDNKTTYMISTIAEVD